jgi:hypothetical protein
MITRLKCIEDEAINNLPMKKVVCTSVVKAISTARK